MNDEEDNVGRFIKKVSEIQYSKDDGEMSSAYLKQIAQEIGLSEGDWKKVQKVYEDHVKRGTGFLSHKNYEDALSEYQQALILHPDSEDTLYSLAAAYEGRSWETGSKTDREMAEKFAKQCLYISPTHQGALELISNLKRITTAPKKKRTALYVTLGIGAGIILLLVMAFLRSV